MSAALQHAPILVVGAGIMGAGIAQVAAQAGHQVFLHDLREGAAEQAKLQLTKSLNALVAKGKLAQDAVDAALARIQPVRALQDARLARLAVEAIVEQLQPKRALFAQLEDVLAADAILATNTSSISVTAIANGLKHPERLVGMHFFNPVPLMKLVEVVSGLQTSPEVAERIYELSRVWGKVPVHAKSTPGFIVNRIARPYYAEALALLQEQAATPEVLDACLKAAGFRMGPCELMDLIGHDTNFSVTRSVYEANFCDKRFVPSLVQRELVDGGLLGRKSGRGFYRYVDGAPVLAAPVAEVLARPALPSAQVLELVGRDAVAEQLAQALQAAGRAFSRASGDWTGLRVDGAQLRLSDGRSASEIASVGLTDVAVFDLPLAAQMKGQIAGALAWAPAVQASPRWVQQAEHWLAALGWAPQRVPDAPGLLVARTVAMLVNEAADAVQQGVCSAEGADAAMKLGVNYPAGPFEWLARWDAAAVVGLLDALDAHYRGERYRASPWLRQRVWAAARRAEQAPEAVAA
jgi:3-hydroxybutyryl-CoA dehydrogenase